MVDKQCAEANRISGTASLLMVLGHIVALWSLLSMCHIVVDLHLMDVKIETVKVVDRHGAGAVPAPHRSTTGPQPERRIGEKTVGSGSRQIFILYQCTARAGMIPLYNKFISC